MCLSTFVAVKRSKIVKYKIKFSVIHMPAKLAIFIKCGNPVLVTTECLSSVFFHLLSVNGLTCSRAISHDQTAFCEGRSCTL